MDFYGTAATAIDQAIKVTIFIKGVISDIRSYEEDRSKFQLKLDLQLTSLEFFRRRFLDQQHGLLLPGGVPEWVADTICKLLLNMSKGLAEYQAIVAGYEFVDSSQENENGDREKWKQSLFERAKTKAKTLKLKGYNWSLFDKKKLIGVLEDYKEWTDSLRDLMQHFSQESIYNIADTVSSMKNMGLEGTGLETVVKRQKLASSTAPESFQGLEGDISEEGTSNKVQLAHWSHNGESTKVIVEHHDYDRRLKYGDLDEEEEAELKAPVRNLAWLLQNSAFDEGDDGDPSLSQSPTIYSLQCLGYQDQPAQERITFLYKLPFAKEGDDSNPGQHLITLHELINKIDPQLKRQLKPSLGERFSIAHCLALTLFNVHGSLWVHKNIWSRGVLLFQQTENGIIPLELAGAVKRLASSGAQKQRVLAFLGDWGYARPVEGATDMRSDFEIEPNFYRHPDRQGVPTRQFGRMHDIYALGVVLLEIGLWRTISQLFDARIKEGQRTGKLPKARDVRTALITLAQKDVAKEMGEQYAAAVVRCLNGDLRNASDTELSFDFKEKVIDAVIPGMKL